MASLATLEEGVVHEGQGAGDAAEDHVLEAAVEEALDQRQDRIGDPFGEDEAVDAQREEGPRQEAEDGPEDGLGGRPEDQRTHHGPLGVREGHRPDLRQQHAQRPVHRLHLVRVHGLPSIPSEIEEKKRSFACFFFRFQVLSR